MEVICLEDAALFALFDKIVTYLKLKENKTADKWVSGEEAMHMMRVTSKTTLQKMRDEGKIRFSQPEKKIILYDTDSIHEYLNQNARETF
ncbi:MAG TPA: helix-turn-helix domain-containing protein [Candidatus Babeliaceae bacterium]|nr:helix-turn-helix domain-containing protein [Candidatus Babeliaceae bacterium]